jgi:preprotein translocase subunit SecE
MEKKWTYLLFALGGLVLAYLLLKIGDWAWSYYGTKPNELLLGALAFGTGGVVAILALRNERLFTLASEVTAELKKVSWPTRQETISATIVVIVTVVIASLVLGVYDALWSFLTRYITP